MLVFQAFLCLLCCNFQYFRMDKFQCLNIDYDERRKDA